jgi:hypothetical protein
MMRKWEKVLPITICEEVVVMSELSQHKERADPMIETSAVPEETGGETPGPGRLRRLLEEVGRQEKSQGDKTGTSQQESGMGSDASSPPPGIHDGSTKGDYCSSSEDVSTSEPRPNHAN